MNDENSMQSLMQEEHEPEQAGCRASRRRPDRRRVTRRDRVVSELAPLVAAAAIRYAPAPASCELGMTTLSVFRIRLEFVVECCVRQRLIEVVRPVQDDSGIFLKL